jgi:mitogen-activated protein kinase kinase
VVSSDGCDAADISLLKDPNARPTYGELLEHPFLLADKDSDVDMAGWVQHALDRQAKRGVVPLAEVAS